MVKQIAITRQLLKIIFHCRFMNITTCIGASPPRMISPGAFRWEQFTPPLIRFPVPEVKYCTRNDFLPAFPDATRYLCCPGSGRLAAWSRSDTVSGYSGGIYSKFLTLPR
jgi:hypothetical protein